VNASGEVVGRSETTSGRPRGFYWSEATGMVALRVPPGSHSGAEDINDRGEIVGFAQGRGALWLPPEVFPDVPRSHPFADEIAWAADRGVADGYPDGTYRPDLEVTRQAMAAFLYRFAGEPPFAPPGTPSFPDVPPDHPFSTEIEWLAAEGIAEGFDDGAFHPTEVVTRQSMAAFLHRFAGEPPFVPPVTPSFPDVPPDHPFFTEIEWQAAAAVATGFGDGSYRPAASVRRAPMAAFLHRLASVVS
jgi:probable HAF family extracellular repeat protein